MSTSTIGPTAMNASAGCRTVTQKKTARTPRAAAMVVLIASVYRSVIESVTVTEMMLSPIQIFRMSLAFRTACRLATKYQPSGKGEGSGALAGSLRRVGIDRHSSAGFSGLALASGLGCPSRIRGLLVHTSASTCELPSLCVGGDGIRRFGDVFHFHQ